jgi:hypothetical protein
MKRLATGLLIAFGAVSLLAADQTTTTAPADSPLVRAAKSTQKAKAKKKIVITNDTLVKSGGHVTTSASNPAPLPILTDVDHTAENQMKQRQAAAQAAAKAKTEAEQKKKHDAAERANAVLEGDDAEGVLEDPALVEARAEKNSPPPTQQLPTVQVQKPPTSFR